MTAPLTQARQHPRRKPYSELIREAFLSNGNEPMNLKQLYEWFKSHMDDGVRWKSIRELEGLLAFTPHTSTAPEEQQHTADVAGMVFHLPPSLCLPSGLACEEQVPFLAAGEMFLKALP
ncbi:hypothetical protein LZ30DRAFT_775346 [Colletotrichum cereale]|nr:hypothetical protein LZ30DRAFT_775346 [Colletotrichum cereale]